MEQFSLEKWLKDKSRKIVTRDGRIVEILKIDAKGNHPIIGVYQFSDTEDMESSWRIDGRKTENEESSFDLFFADEEKLNSIIDELKSYLEKTPKEQVEKDWKEIQDWYTQHFTNEKHNKKEELTEFEKELQIIISEASHWTSDDGSISTYCQFGDKEIKKISGQLLDLARKELEANYYTKVLDDRMVFKSELHATDLQTAYDMGKQDALKDLPKWKKAPSHEKQTMYGMSEISDVYYNGYFIHLDDIYKALPKK